MTEIEKTSKILTQEMTTLNESQLHELFVFYYKLNHQHANLLAYDKFDEFRCCCEHPDMQIYERFCQYYDFYQLCVSLQKESVAIFKEKRKNHLSTALRGNKF